MPQSRVSVASFEPDVSITATPPPRRAVSVASFEPDPVSAPMQRWPGQRRPGDIDLSTSAAPPDEIDRQRAWSLSPARDQARGARPIAPPVATPPPVNPVHAFPQQLAAQATKALEDLQTPRVNPDGWSAQIRTRRPSDLQPITRDLTPEEMAAAERMNRAPAPPLPSAIPSPVKPTVAGEFGKAFVQGTLGSTAESLAATTAQLYGDRTGLEAVRAQDAALLAPAVTASLMDDPRGTLGNPLWWAQIGGQTTGSIAQLMSAGRIGGRMLAVLGESWLEGQSAYQRALDAGATPLKAGEAAVGIMAVNIPMLLATNRPLFDAPTKSTILNALFRSGSEAGQEVSQQAAANEMQRRFDPNQSRTEGLAESALIGGLVGPLAGAGLDRSPALDTGAVRPLERPPAPPPSSEALAVPPAPVRAPAVVSFQPEGSDAIETGLQPEGDQPQYSGDEGVRPPTETGGGGGLVERATPSGPDEDTLGAIRPIGPTETAPAAGEYYTMPPEAIKVDAARFQFKAGANVQGVTAQAKIEGPWQEARSGVLMVWQDPADEETYVVNGHHRLAAAKARGVQRVAVRFLEAPDAKTARVEGALTNIAEDKGTPLDAAKLIRDAQFTPEKLMAAGLSSRSALLRDGIGLATLSDPLFARVANGEIAEATGAAIGSAGLSPEGQAAVAQLVERQQAKGRTLTPAQVRVLADDVAQTPEVKAGSADGQTDIFGTLLGEERTQNVAVEKAVLRDWARSQLAKDRRLFGYVAKGERAAELSRGGNVINVEASKAIAEDAAVIGTVFDRLSHATGPVSSALNTAAGRIAGGEQPHDVRTALLADVRTAVAAELGRRTPDPGTAGSSPRSRPTTSSERRAPAPQAVTERRARDVGRLPLDVPVARGGTDAPPRDQAAYLPQSTYQADLRKTYHAGGPPRSSRLHPQAAPVPPVGTWMIEDRHTAIDGHEIEQLVTVPVENIEISEDTGREKWPDVKRYAEWTLEGKEAPPISVVQTDRGTLKTLDHRRLLAAKAAGQSEIKAWMSWSTTSDRPGQPKVGLTYELAQRGKRPLPVSPARSEATIFTDDATALARIRTELSPRSQPADVLDTGEVQPRLPEAGQVREQNIATPQFEIPFSLTPQTVKPSTSKRSDRGDLLFETQASPTRRPFSDPPKRILSTLPPPLRTSRTPLRPSELVKTIETRFGKLPIRTGRFREPAHGIYKEQPEVIRLKVANDLATLAHELGHHVDLAIFGQDLPYGLYRDELLALGAATSRPSYSQEQQLKEGAAEFFRLFVGDPIGAQEQAPKYHQAFEEALETQPAVAVAIRQTQADIQAYLSQDLATRGRARIDFVGSDQASSLLQQFRDDPAAALTKLETLWVDDLAVARHMVEALDQEQGRPTPVSQSGYGLARLSRGASGKAQGFLRYGVRAAEGTFLSGSLEQALSPVKAQLQQFAEHLVALRAIELRNRGMETGLSREEALAILADAVTNPDAYAVAAGRYEDTKAELAGLEKLIDSGGALRTERERHADLTDELAFLDRRLTDLMKPDAAAFEPARRAVFAYQDAIVAYAQEHGAVSASQVRAMKRLNRLYVPFQRVMDVIEGSITGMARKLANRGSPFKRIKGSGRDIINPIESIIKNTFSVVDMVEKNRAMAALVDQAMAVQGAGKFIEKIPTPLVRTKFNLADLSGDITQKLEDQGIELPKDPEVNFDTIVSIFTPAQFAARGSDLVTVIKDGERAWYAINDKSLYQMLTAVGPQASKLVIGLFYRPVAWLRAGATLTVGFIARNPIRDTFVAGVQSRYGFKPVIDTVRGLYSYLKADQYYQDAMDAGVMNASVVSLDRDTIREELRAMTRAGTMRYVPRSPLEALRALSEAMELATRLGEFRLGVQAEGHTVEGRARAALAARDVTMDFGRAGTFAREWNSYSAFFNARVQGYARMAELLKDDARKVRAGVANPLHYASGRAAATIATLSAVLWMLNHDDEEYQEIAEWERNTYWHVPLPTGGYIRLPKPFEYGAIFGNTTEAALAFLQTRDPEKLKGLLPTGPGPSLRSLAMMMVPTAVLPAMEVLANYDFFRDRSIISPFDTDLAPELQASRWTSSTAKAIGGLMGVSPAQIDHLVFGYTAGLGRAVMTAPDVLLRAMGQTSMPAATAADLPLVGTLYREGYSSQATSLQDLYDASEEIAGYERSLRLFRANGDIDKVKALTEAHAADLRRAPAIKAGVATMRDLRDRINTVYANTQWTPVQKRQHLDVLYEQMVRIARQALGRSSLPAKSTPKESA